MNYAVIWTSRFKKDYKLLMKQGADISLLDDVIRLLSTGATLPEQYRDHALTGNYSDFRECHIKPDWLLIYFRDGLGWKRKKPKPSVYDRNSYLF